MSARTVSEAMSAGMTAADVARLRDQVRRLARTGER